MTTEEKARAYDKAIEAMKDCISDEDGYVTIRPCDIFPKLAESEDERIRNVIRGWIYTRPASFFDNGISKEEMLAWLEKQGEKPTINDEVKSRIAKGIMSSYALSFIHYLDDHSYEGKMCVSNGECEDIENAFQNAMWDRLHRYYCKFIEKPINTTMQEKAEIDGAFTRMMLGGSKWSTRDEMMFDNCLHFLKLQMNHHASTCEIEGCIDWLKSIKQRMEE